MENDDEGDKHDKVPLCWFEDEDTGTPLRWHLFTGVIYDLLKRKRKTNNNNNSNNNSCRPLLWKIRIHFTSYPSHEILPLDENDMTKTIEKIYSNSLKQVLFLQHGSSKVVMGMTKSNHGRLWDAIVRSSYDDFWEVSQDLLAKTLSSANDGSNNNGG